MKSFAMKLIDGKNTKCCIMPGCTCKPDHDGDHVGFLGQIIGQDRHGLKSTKKTNVVP